jgi:elongation factor Tu
LIRGIRKDEVSRGAVLATPKTIKAYDMFEAKVYILTHKEGGRRTGFASKYKPQFFFRTLNITGSIILPAEHAFVMPGDSLIISVQLVYKHH